MHASAAPLAARPPQLTDSDAVVMHAAPLLAWQPCVAGDWVKLLATGLPSAVAFFMNYIIIHAFSTNVFRFFW